MAKSLSDDLRKRRDHPPFFIAWPSARKMDVSAIEKATGSADLAIDVRGKRSCSRDPVHGNSAPGVPNSS